MKTWMEADRMWAWPFPAGSYWECKGSGASGCQGTSPWRKGEVTRSAGLGEGGASVVRLAPGVT